MAKLSNDLSRAFLEPPAHTVALEPPPVKANGCGKHSMLTIRISISPILKIYSKHISLRLSSSAEIRLRCS